MIYTTDSVWPSLGDAIEAPVSVIYCDCVDPDGSIAFMVIIVMSCPVLGITVNSLVIRSSCRNYCAGSYAPVDVSVTETIDYDTTTDAG